MDFSVSFSKVEYDPSEYITNTKIKIHKEAKLVNLQNIRSGGLVGIVYFLSNELECNREGSLYPRRYRHRLNREKYNDKKWHRYQSLYTRNRWNRMYKIVFVHWLVKSRRELARISIGKNTIIGLHCVVKAFWIGDCVWIGDGCTIVVSICMFHRIGRRMHHKG